MTRRASERKREIKIGMAEDKADFDLELQTRQVIYVIFTREPRSFDGHFLFA